MTVTLRSGGKTYTGRNLKEARNKRDADRKKSKSGQSPTKPTPVSKPLPPSAWDKRIAENRARFEQQQKLSQVPQPGDISKTQFGQRFNQFQQQQNFNNLQQGLLAGNPQSVVDARKQLEQVTTPANTFSVSNRFFPTSDAAQPPPASGFSNVVPTLSAALNPFSDVQVRANVQNPLLKKGLEYIGNHPFQTALIATGAAQLGKSLVSSLARVGTSGLPSSVSTTAQSIASNAATKATTTSWLTKLAAPLTNPQFVAGALVTVIGSYPFAGFIKEEALQTLGFSVTTALQNNDLDGAQAALNQQKEVLNPDLWDQIKGNIPFVNVLTNLDDFYKAATNKYAIDKKIVDDLRIQAENNESDDQFWERINTQRIDQERQMIDYYNDQRKQLLEWEREAQKQARNEDAAFWERQRKHQADEERKEREAQAKFWFEYRKALLKLQEDSRPSKLNFGLL